MLIDTVTEREENAPHGNCKEYAPHTIKGSLATPRLLRQVTLPYAKITSVATDTADSLSQYGDVLTSGMPRVG